MALTWAEFATSDRGESTGGPKKGAEPATNGVATVNGSNVLTSLSGGDRYVIAFPAAVDDPVKAIAWMLERLYRAQLADPQDPKPSVVTKTGYLVPTASALGEWQTIYQVQLRADESDLEQDLINATDDEFGGSE